MKQITPVNTEIQDYLRGAARAPNFQELASVTDAEWPRLADEVLEKRKLARATSFLTFLSDEALIRIAHRDIQMVDELASAKLKIIL